MCRFYSFNLADVRAMTLTQFSTAMDEMGNIVKLENGESAEKPMTGKAAQVAAQMMCKRGNI
ncbi:MAG: hypothetical protein GY841_08690 [FCB group bacterium]|nr:hypothetical protein [FCB group bacterium]